MEKNEIFTLVKNEVESLANREIENPDQDIFKDNILDSLNVIHVITFIESRFDVQINPFDLNLDTLGSLNKITEYINEKIA